MNSRMPLAKQGEGVPTPPIRPDAVRSVIQVVDGEKTSDGAGVLLTRVIGTGALPQLDPFLLLDAFHSDDPSAYIAGFPDHPHRGFETVTYMVAGRLRHRDNKGHSGVVGPGGVQWMTAGRGIVHSEMPEQVDGLMAGFQLWINLPAKHKMTEPRYRDIAPGEIPAATVAGGAVVRVIAGDIAGLTGPVDSPETLPIYVEVALPAAATFVTALPADHAACVHLFEGAADVGTDLHSTRLSSGQLGVLGPGAAVAVRASGEGARLLLLAGRPLDEPIARYGPFVMNTHGEIRQAVADFTAGRF